MNNEQQLCAYAKAGDTEKMLDYISSIESDPDEESNLMYQWLQVAMAYGSEEAAEIADDLYETQLHVADETVACLHFEVAQWFIEGNHAVEKNIDYGLDQLARAEDLHLMDSIEESEVDLIKLRNQLPDEGRARFDEIFPGLE